MIGSDGKIMSAYRIGETNNAGDVVIECYYCGTTDDKRHNKFCRDHQDKRNDAEDKEGQCPRKGCNGFSFMGLLCKKHREIEELKEGAEKSWNFNRNHNNGVMAITEAKKLFDAAIKFAEDMEDGIK